MESAKQVTFAFLLRQARERAVDPKSKREGRLSQERLAELIGERLGTPSSPSNSTILNWETGEDKDPKAPRPPAKDRSLLCALIGVLAELGGLPTYYDANALLLAGGYAPLRHKERKKIYPLSKPGEQEVIRSPYMGLQVFDEGDADLFFGRETLVQLLIDKTRNAPFLVVAGASGSGKSSVVRAGLVPALKEGGILYSEEWYYAPTISPGDKPLYNLAEALILVQKQGVEQIPLLRSSLVENPRTLISIAKMLGAGKGGKRLVLIVDQFEELWTLAPTDAERREAFFLDEQLPFLRVLLEAATIEDSPVRIVITIRADFMDRFAQVREVAREYARLITDQFVFVSPMQPDEMRLAIVEPAKLEGYSFQEGLVEKLITDAQDLDGGLPLLEFTLDELWRRANSSGQTIIQAETFFDDLGGLGGALARKADYIVENKLSGTQIEDLRTMLLRLVRLGEGTRDTKRPAYLKVLSNLLGDRPLEEVQDLLQPLVNARLLTTSVDINRNMIVEITHDTLIDEWPRLKEWIKESRNDIRFAEDIEGAANLWEENDYHKSFLWGELRLSRTNDWLKTTRLRIGVKEQHFLSKSEEKELYNRQQLEKARRDQENAKKRGKYLIVSGIALVIFMILAGYALWARSQAEQSAQEAQQARAQAQAVALAAEGISELNESPEQSILLERAAASVSLEQPEPMVMRGLFQVYDQANLHYIFKDDTFAASHFAWSPDGKSIALSNESDTFIVWDIETKQIRLRVSYAASKEQGVRDTPKEIVTMAWSPDGKWIATGGWDHVARIFDASTGQEVATLLHDKPFQSIVWSPDSQSVATGTGDLNVDSGVDPQIIAIRLWNFLDDSVVKLAGHDGVVVDVAWSPDGQYILSGSGDKTVRVWGVSTQSEIKRWTFSDGILRVAWSPDGMRIAASFDWKTQVWSFADDTPPLQLIGHKDTVWSVDWSPDGSKLLTGSDDTNLRIWDTRSGLLLQTLVGQSSVVRGAWSPGGEMIFSTADGIGRIWKTKSEAIIQQVSHSVKVTSVDWGERNNLVVSADDNGSVLVWEALRGLKQHELPHPDPVQYVKWIKDDTAILSADERGVVRIWDAISWKLIREWNTESRSISWEPHNEFIATGGGNAYVWDSATGVLIKKIDITEGLKNNPLTTSLFERPRWEGRGILAESVAWSPDGIRLAVGVDVPSINPGQSGVVQIWNVKTEALEQVLITEGREVIALAWSPDGGKLVSANYGPHQPEVWDVENGQRLFKLLGHSDFIHLFSWSPDGSKIMTSSADGTARVWDAKSGFEFRILPTRQEFNRSFSVAAWSSNGKFIVTAGQNDVIVWNADMELITADLTRRLCQLHSFSDTDIKVAIPTWRGCNEELQSIDRQLKEYDLLYRN